MIKALHPAGAFQHNYLLSAWLVVIAAVIDALDGVASRGLGKTGTFGIAFDSLSDVIIFAVVPSTLLYACLYQGQSVFFIIVPMLYLVGAAYRLARFNTLALKAQGRRLLGLTTPMSAIIIVAALLIVADLHRLGIIQEVSFTIRYAITGLAIINLLLMISTIEFMTMDNYCFRDKRRIALPLIAIFAPLFLLRFRFLAASVLVLVLAYIVESLGRWILRPKA